MNQQQWIESFRQLPLEEQRAVLAQLQREVPQAAFAQGNITSAKSIDRSQEYQWVAENKQQYAGQWVALKGKQLMAHSPKFKEVSAQLKQQGITDALMLHIEAADALPYAGI
ncbi:MAG TPA: DUF5678 domain-containing protein [Blastocatellia bacterium]|nr:DUF5678 domain-containing protein [Blastocatellia bacterium]